MFINCVLSVCADWLFFFGCLGGSNPALLLNFAFENEDSCFVSLRPDLLRCCREHQLGLLSFVFDQQQKQLPVQLNVWTYADSAEQFCADLGKALQEEKENEHKVAAVPAASSAVSAQSSLSDLLAKLLDAASPASACAFRDLFAFHYGAAKLNSAFISIPASPASSEPVRNIGSVGLVLQIDGQFYGLTVGHIPQLSRVGSKALVTFTSASAGTVTVPATVAHVELSAKILEDPVPVEDFALLLLENVTFTSQLCTAEILSQKLKALEPKGQYDPQSSSPSVVMFGSDLTFYQGAVLSRLLLANPGTGDVSWRYLARYTSQIRDAAVGSPVVDARSLLPLGMHEAGPADETGNQVFIPYQLVLERITARSPILVMDMSSCTPCQPVCPRSSAPLRTFSSLFVVFSLLPLPLRNPSPKLSSFYLLMCVECSQY